MTTANGEQQDIHNLTTKPSVQRSLCLEEATGDSNSTRVELSYGVDNQTRDMLERLYGLLWKSRRSKSQNEVSCTKRSVSSGSTRNTTSSLLERNTSSGNPGFDNEFFDLVDLRKFKPKNYVTSRWVLSIETDKQGNFLRAKARWVLRGFQDKQKEYLQTDSPASTGPGFRMSCQMAASHSWDLFHIDLKTAFLLQGQFCDVNRDVVCQLPPEAGHPPFLAAKKKKPAYGWYE